MNVTSKDNWIVKEMPVQNKRLDFQRAYTESDFQLIAAGLIAKEMEDKWFIYFEDPWLYLHRSWSGVCIYKVRIVQDGERSLAVEAVVNRDTDQYRLEDDDYDLRIVDFLIDNLLLHRNTSFPLPPGNRTSATSSVFQHQIAGTGCKEYILSSTAPTQHDRRDLFRGCLLGLAVGDAIGAAVEFCPRGSFQPLKDMVGGGPFKLLPGQWTDDTSMALCLAVSLLGCDGFNARDVMNKWCRWQEKGYLSSNGRCFDIGRTTATSLQKFRKTGDPFAGSTDPGSAGNGCIMRLAPVPMFYFHSPNDAEDYAAESSRTTHGATECIDACRLLSRIIIRVLSGYGKEKLLSDDIAIKLSSDMVAQIAKRDFRHIDSSQIHGSGYVCDSLEAALWCFYQTDSFGSAVLLAANLGDDADTTAAICGQIAGAYYGASNIPASWLEKLTMHTEILEIADKLYNHQ